METKPRPVRIATYFSVLHKYPVPFRLSIIFILLPLFIMLPVIFLINRISQSPYEKYDYAKIDKEGTPLKGRITNVRTDADTRINNRHPSIISYTYLMNGKETTSEFKTLAPEKAQQIKAGDSIAIKVLNNESEIVNLKPFHFPFFVFYFIPIPLLLTGIGFGIYLSTRLFKEISLYKYGNTQEATIMAITDRVYTRTNISRKIIDVDYSYTTITGTKIQGSSRAINAGTVSSKKPGDAIKIFVSVKDETKSCIVPIEQALQNNWQV